MLLKSTFMINFNKFYHKYLMLKMVNNWINLLTMINNKNNKDNKQKLNKNLTNSSMTE